MKEQRNTGIVMG